MLTYCTQHNYKHTAHLSHNLSQSTLHYVTTDTWKPGRKVLKLSLSSSWQLDADNFYKSLPKFQAFPSEAWWCQLLESGKGERGATASSPTRTSQDPITMAEPLTTHVAGTTNRPQRPVSVGFSTASVNTYWHTSKLNSKIKHRTIFTRATFTKDVEYSQLFVSICTSALGLLYVIDI